MFFYLRNRNIKKRINIIELGVIIPNIVYSLYLGVTLDRALTFQEYCIRTNVKIQTTNNNLNQQSGTQWRTRPHTMRTTGLTLCF